MEKLPRWNLKEYYGGLNDPKLKKDENFVLSELDKFSRKYKGKIRLGKMPAVELRKIILEYENLLRVLDHLEIYSTLVYSTNQNDEDNAAFFQRINELEVEFEKKTMFVYLEIKEWSQNVFDKYCVSKDLFDYKYFLFNIYKFKKHTLSEKEELILAEKSLPARSGWQRAFAETTSDLKFKIKLGKKEQKINLETTLGLLNYDFDRKNRQQAAASFTDTLQEKRKLYTLIYNNLILDKSQTDKLRKFGAPEEVVILHDQNEVKTVELIEEITVKNYNLVAKHYNLKRKILKVGELRECDRYASLALVKENKISFLEAKKIVLDSFREVDEELYRKAKMFFDNNWIDAPTYNGKRGGAYCIPGSDQKNPRVLLNFTNNHKDVLTLAHELGHGIHALYSQKQNFLNFSHTIPMAEIASTFCEHITFEYLINRVENKKIKLQLLSKKIEDQFATIFRQMAFYRFEKEVHRKRIKGELKSSEINKIWQKELQAMFGKSLKLSDGHRYWWQYVAHFINTPFYVYGYVFGNLISLALYNRFKLEGKDFLIKYKNMLSAGGSDSPKKLLAAVGVKIEDRQFWLGGFRQLKELIELEEKLIKEII